MGSERRHKTIAEQFAQWCVHYTGTIEPECKAGVNYRAHVGGDNWGWATRLPCIRSHTGVDVVPCPLQRFPTEEECAAHQREHDESMTRFTKAMQAIAPFRKTHRGRAFSTPCPACGTGMLHGSIAASNGHARVACETPGCARWME